MLSFSPFALMFLHPNQSSIVLLHIRFDLLHREALAYSMLNLKSYEIIQLHMKIINLFHKRFFLCV